MLFCPASYVPHTLSIWMSPVQTITPYLRYTLTLCSHLCLGLANDLLPSGSLNKIDCACFLYHACYMNHLSHLPWFIAKPQFLQHFVNHANHEAPHYAVFAICFLLPLSGPNIMLSKYSGSQCLSWTATNKTVTNIKLHFQCKVPVSLQELTKYQ
jgi:hypothetical protein